MTKQAPQQKIRKAAGAVYSQLPQHGLSTSAKAARYLLCSQLSANHFL